MNFKLVLAPGLSETVYFCQLCVLGMFPVLKNDISVPEPSTNATNKSGSNCVFPILSKFIA